MYDDQRLKISTLDNIQTVLHEVFDIALDDELIRKNPTDKALQELKKAHKGDSEKRQSLTIKQERILLDYLKRTPQYSHWYPIFRVMVATGIEVTMDIYADCTKEMAYKALDTIQDFYATYAKPYAKQNNDGVELCREA